MTKSKTTFLGGVLCRLALGALLVAPAGVASAQMYPDKPIKIYGGFPAGGWVDMTNRMLAGVLESVMKTQIINVPTPGAGGAIASQKVKNLKADGYSLMLQSSGTLFSRPLINNLPFGEQDFTPIATVGATVLTLSVHKDAKWKTLTDFIADAKANPGKFNYTTAGPGGQGHMAMVAVAAAAGIDITHVPSRGGPASVAAVVGGHVELVSGDNTNPELRPLAVTLPARSKFFPGVPTVWELGYDVDFVTRFMLIGPKGIVQDRVDKLVAAVGKAVKKRTYQALLNGIQMEVLFEPHAELGPIWKTEAAKLKTVIESLGMAHYQKKKK